MFAALFTLLTFQPIQSNDPILPPGPPQRPLLPEPSKNRFEKTERAFGKEEKKIADERPARKEGDLAEKLAKLDKAIEALGANNPLKMRPVPVLREPPPRID
jgi:hypothetical protein